MKAQLLEHSYRKNLSHIPSALSMLDYVEVLFAKKFVIPYRDSIVIGKPFGSQAYYLTWQNLGYLDSIDNLSVGVKHDEINFVDYGEETMGNALGVAAGIAIACPNKKVWVNITDASLQMGNVIEALQFIGHNKIKNVFVTVDYNNAQVTGDTDKILSVDPIIELCKHYNWWVQEVDGHDKDKLRASFNNLTDTLPNIVFCKTVKGHGFSSMTSNIKLWHYKKISGEEELHKLMDEIK